MARAFARLALIQCCSERDETIRPSDEGNIKVAPGVRGDAAGLCGSADFRHPFFRSGHMARHRDETHLGAGFMSLDNDITDYPFRGVITFFEKLRQLSRIAIDFKGQLREVVAANREAVKTRGEVFR